jgi:mono/diheme cytochrome c family protein
MIDRWAAAAAFVLTVALTLPAAAADTPVDPEDLRPGLVAAHSDGKVKISRLEPTVALSLGAEDTAHPRLAAGADSAAWQGYLNVLRPGTFRFSTLLRGKLRLVVADKVVLETEVKEQAPRLEIGQPLRLEAGVHALRAEFTRLPGPARVQVFWQAPQFRTEPIPYDFLGHLPAQLPSGWNDDQLSERGRVLAEEYGCVRCHEASPADRLALGLVARQGPDLSRIGQRAFAGWIFDWLASPGRLRSGAVMPELFSPFDEAGRVERYAVARYLASLGGPLGPSSLLPRAQQQQRVHRGERLYAAVGCAACHDVHSGSPAVEKPSESRILAINAQGSKTTAEKLAAYLQNPLTVAPDGRMPNMMLQGEEARDLAYYLCQTRTPGVEISLPAAPSADLRLAAFKRRSAGNSDLAAFQLLSEEAQWLDLGKRLVVEKGCTNCHTLAVGGKPLPRKTAQARFERLRETATLDRGCLASQQGKDAPAPWFRLGDADRRALVHFLRHGADGAGSRAPAYAAAAAIERLNCLACHVRDGHGGLTPALLDELRKVERAENSEAVSPPPLTGVGHKLRTPWLRQVLLSAGRARPWMSLRMPQFGEANVGGLPEGFALLDGASPDDKVHTVPLNTATVAAGRLLVGKKALGCISCHDIAGIPNTGTRGPDLASMDQRVRYDWYRRWLEQPQRMQPGTRMPSEFPDGKSVQPNVLGGNADAQAEAIWAYLSLGPNLPLPEGLEPPKGLTLAVTDRPILLRTFMPDAGPRALAVGYPGGLSLAFDAATCRLAYAWSGNFLDASPVWNDRGGNPAHLLGARFWTAPKGCPWSVTYSSATPNFLGQAKDPAFGAALPEGQVYSGPSRLHFDGYAVDGSGTPTFHYRLEAENGAGLVVAERPGPLSHQVAAGLARQFTLELPAQANAWLWAGQSGGEPRVFDTLKASFVPLDLKSGAAEVPAAQRLVVLAQGGGRIAVLEVEGAPEGAHWVLQKVEGWLTLLRLPGAAANAKLEVALHLWVLPRDEPALLRELRSAK